MRKIVAVCAMGLAAVAAAGTNDCSKAQPKELKVLMIGNSFSMSVGKEFPKVAKAMGLRLDLGSLAIGGCPLSKHWNCWVAGTTNKATHTFYRNINGKEQKKAQLSIQSALATQRWDIVTFQQASHLSWVAKSYQPYADDLQAAIRERLPEAEFVWQETWSYTPFDGRLKTWKIDQDEMYEKLHAAYAAAAKDQRIIPTGKAVQLWRKELPVAYKPDSLGGDVVGGGTFTKQEDGTFKFKGDPFHLNPRGHYLQGLVWTAALFGVDVTACPYAPAKMKPEEAALMRRVAMEAVRGR